MNEFQRRTVKLFFRRNRGERTGGGFGNRAGSAAAELHNDVVHILFRLRTARAAGQNPLHRVSEIFRNDLELKEFLKRTAVQDDVRHGEK